MVGSSQSAAATALTFCDRHQVPANDRDRADLPAIARPRNCASRRRSCVLGIVLVVSFGSAAGNTGFAHAWSPGRAELSKRRGAGPFETLPARAMGARTGRPQCRALAI